MSHADLLAEMYGAVTRRVEALEPAQFLAPTRTRAWCVQDLLFHQLLDAQRALMAFATPADAEPDVDEVTYWRAFHPEAGDGGVAHARFVRIASSAYPSPDVLVEHWRNTSEAAVRAARAAGERGRIGTQGHVLDVPAFVHTLLVEATVHYLDLTLDVGGPAPSEEALGAVRQVLDGLLGEAVPERWSAVEHVLKGTGREPLSEQDRADLGPAADRFPLFG
jgi:hypothetical protein